MSFLSSMFGGGNIEKTFAPTDKTYQNLLNILNQRVKAQGSNIADTALFRTGLGQLQDVSRTLADAQTARSAAAGTLGTETDIAAGASRAQALSQGLRGLIQTVQQDQRTAGQADMRNLMNVLGMIDRNLRYEAALKEARRRETMQLLSQGVSSVVGSFASPEGAGTEGGHVPLGALGP